MGDVATTAATLTAALLVAASGLAGAACGVADDDVRHDQAELLRNTCVSMRERAAPDSPAIARAAAGGDPRAYMLPDGSSGDRRAVDVLMANCFAGPFGVPPWQEPRDSIADLPAPAIPAP